MTITLPEATSADLADLLGPHRPEVADLAEQAERLSDRMEAERRTPPELYRAAVHQGLFRQLVPAALGGRGDTPLDWFRTGVALARRSPSFGWVVTQGAAELAWIGAGGDEVWSRQVLADPDATSASTTAGLGTLVVHGDTATLSGRWSFDTGSPDATWIGGLALVKDPHAEAAGMSLRMCWVPAERADVLDDWDTTGMRGTGSHSVAITEQEIPLTWTIDLFSPTTNDRGPYRVLVGNGNWPIAGAVAATQLGIARRALDETWRLVVDKAPAPAFTPLAANAAVGSSRVDLQACKLEYSIVSPK